MQRDLNDLNVSDRGLRQFIFRYPAFEPQLKELPQPNPSLGFSVTVILTAT